MNGAAEDAGCSAVETALNIGANKHEHPLASEECSCDPSRVLCSDLWIAIVSHVTRQIRHDIANGVERPECQIHQ